MEREEHGPADAGRPQALQGRSILPPRRCMTRRANRTYCPIPGPGSDRLKEFTAEAHIFMKQLLEESDRGAAVVGVAFLDELLGRLLKSRMLDGKTTEDLFEGSSPLATFSARINVAYCLGCIVP